MLEDAKVNFTEVALLVVFGETENVPVFEFESVNVIDVEVLVEEFTKKVCPEAETVNVVPFFVRDTEVGLEVNVDANALANPSIKTNTNIDAKITDMLFLILICNHSAVTMLYKDFCFP
jgi:hypothetical protein